MVYLGGEPGNDRRCLRFNRNGGRKEVRIALIGTPLENPATCSAIGLAARFVTLPADPRPGSETRAADADLAGWDPRTCAARLV